MKFYRLLVLSVFLFTLNPVLSKEISEQDDQLQKCESVFNFMASPKSPHTFMAQTKDPTARYALNLIQHDNQEGVFGIELSIFKGALSMNEMKVIQAYVEEELAIPQESLLSIGMYDKGNIMVIVRLKNNLYLVEKFIRLVKKLEQKTLAAIFNEELDRFTFQEDTQLNLNFD